MFNCRALEDIKIEPVNLKKRRKTKNALDSEGNSKRQKKEEILDLNSGFSMILPYIFDTKLKNEYQDIKGGALNQSALIGK